MLDDKINININEEKNDSRLEALQKMNRSQSLDPQFINKDIHDVGANEEKDSAYTFQKNSF